MLALLVCAACADAPSSDPAARDAPLPGTARVAVRLPPPLQRALAASAVVRAPYRSADGAPLFAPDGTPIVSSCGATFIGPHLAVTAAHCVDGSTGDGQTVEVTFVDVRDDVRWQKSAALVGTYPSWQHPRLEAADGYTASARQCRVEAACSGKPIDPAVSPGCPIAEMPGEGADIALLRCDDDLPPGRGWVAIADTIAPGDTVRHVWAYELYAADTPGLDRDAYDAHYLSLDPEHPERSYHYYGWSTHQPLPLVDEPFVVDGKAVAHAVIGVDETRVGTDLFGCHGTSGSGLFRLHPVTGAYELVGAALSVSSPEQGSALCLQAGAVAPGVPALVFSPPAQLRVLAAHAAE